MIVIKLFIKGPMIKNVYIYITKYPIPSSLQALSSVFILCCSNTQFNDYVYVQKYRLCLTHQLYTYLSDKYTIHDTMLVLQT